MVNLILCGGSGTRLWPLSRKQMPKQFTNIRGDISLFQKTVERNHGLSGKYCIVCGRDYQFIAEHQIEQMNSGREEISYILEPVGRNTAPAIALACFHYAPEEVILVTPSDHEIADKTAYAKIVSIAEEQAKKNRLVTFGIKPAHPETGFGYIEAADSNGEEAMKVKSFEEKPDLATAEKYCASGKHFWNSGMFVFKAGVFLSELKKYNPGIYDAALSAYKNSNKDSADEKSLIIEIKENDMKNIPADSIDYAVMEKSDKVFVISADIGWNDLGCFDALYETGDKDADGNSFFGNVSSLESRENLVIGSSRKIALAGVKDLIIVDTPDALLVCERNKSQMVKDAVALVQNSSLKDADLALFHATVYRPWGTYTVLEEGKGYKIKNITVKPGKRLSLQKHSHRSEHWVVVCGTADVRVGEKEVTVKPNESTYIPIGEVHRLANNGKIDLTIIETQVGEYLGEDDIIRIEDDFKR